MPHINHLLWDRVPEHLKGMEYLPDVFLFQLEQFQYTRLWQNLSSAKYIYTNGYEIKPTSWLTYVSQSIRGWLGFENHCQFEKISYALNKLAYYGYAQHFVQPDFLKVRGHYPSLKNYLAVNDHNESTTALLQHQLMRNFFKIEPDFTFDHPIERLRSNHRFGDSWMKIGAIEMVPMMDPQDDSLILEVIRSFEQKRQKSPFLKDSKYARIAAKYYYEKAKNTPVPSFFASWVQGWEDPRPGYLDQALSYDPKVSHEDPQAFIEHYLKRKDYQSAFNLLELLSDPQLILRFLLLIPDTSRFRLITKDSSLAILLAKYYLERKQYSFAQQLSSNIEELSPIAAFLIAIQENSYIQAHEIFARHEQNSSFPLSERKKLALIFSKMAEEVHEIGLNHRQKKLWSDTEEYYLRSLSYKKIAYHVHPTKENLEDVYTHQRLYAQVLIDTDLDLNQPEASNLANIQKALSLLRDYRSTSIEEQHYQKVAIAKALMRRIDTLCEKISFTYTPIDAASILEHKNKHQQEIAILITTLEELILLLEGSTDKDLLLKLGKAFYLHADIHEFFSINSPYINQNYKKAMEAVPDNPFYMLRVAEIFEPERDELQNRGVPKLKSMGFDVFDYLHWSNERWVKKEKIIYNINDIHIQPPISPAGHTSWLFRL